MVPIWDYLVDGKLPSDPKEAFSLERDQQGSPFIGEPFISKASLRPFLKCVGKEDANYILREVHKGICGNHIGARDLGREKH